MKKLSKKERARIDEIIRRLIERYGGESHTYLLHENAWQLLFATILSAQCTDDRVNMVTRDLFKKYKTLEDFAGADLKEMEDDIHSTGFYHNKAKNIIACARMLLSEYGGVVPKELEKLIVLPGVGRKTANVVRGNIFNIPSIVELMEVLPESAWIIWNLDVIALGREICTARAPKCDRCFLSDVCPSCK